MSKVSTLLLKYGELVKENESGSSYYKIADKKVRVSNHINSVFLPDVLNILIPSNSKKQYIVVLYNKMYIYESFTALRIFLENWILILKSLEEKTKIKECDQIRTLNKKLKELYDSYNNIVQLHKSFSRFHQCNDKQKQQILKQINGFVLDNKK